MQYVCIWVIFSYDMSCKIEIYYYVVCFNEDFLQCVVYDLDELNV